MGLPRASRLLGGGSQGGARTSPAVAGAVPTHDNDPRRTICGRGIRDEPVWRSDEAVARRDVSRSREPERTRSRRCCATLTGSGGSSPFPGASRRCLPAHLGWPESGGLHLLPCRMPTPFVAETNRRVVQRLQQPVGFGDLPFPHQHANQREGGATSDGIGLGCQPVQVEHGPSFLVPPSGEQICPEQPADLQVVRVGIEIVVGERDERAIDLLRSQRQEEAPPAFPGASPPSTRPTRGRATHAGRSFPSRPRLPTSPDRRPCRNGSTRGVGPPLGRPPHARHVGRVGEHAVAAHPGAQPIAAPFRPGLL